MTPDRVAAAIDVGSNTVHMLAGRWRDGRIDPVADASELVGLGDDVYDGGAVSPARLEAVARAVAGLVRLAREHGAEHIALVGTAAVRDAANAAELIAALRDSAGIAPEVISGEREAELTYRGAAAGETASSLQVCDVGGGSTEVIRAEEGRVILRTSLPIGSARLSRAFKADPPTGGEIAVAVGAATRAAAALPAWQPERVIVTGGSATALARIAGREERRYVMAADELARVRALLATRSATEIAAAHGIEAARARLLPAGAAIIGALREAAGAWEVVLTAAGLRDGLLIEYFERGA